MSVHDQNKNRGLSGHTSFEDLEFFYVTLFNDDAEDVVLETRRKVTLDIFIVLRLTLLIKMTGMIIFTMMKMLNLTSTNSI